MSTEATLESQTQTEEHPVTTLRHGAVIINLSLTLGQYVAAHGLGWVFAPQTTYHLPLPDAPKPQEREPDLSFVRTERLPADLDIEPEIPPDLAVEVVSRTDTYGSVEERVHQYLQSGTQLVWIIRPRLRTVEVYRPGAPPQLLADGAELTDERLLPGFRMPVGDLFV